MAFTTESYEMATSSSDSSDDREIQVAEAALKVLLLFLHSDACHLHDGR